MKIAAVCVTYLRPRQLGHLLRCFELQDHPAELRELVILDDAGQYLQAAPSVLMLADSGPGWRLYSTAKRFPTLGEKRNAAARLVSDDVEGIAVWDDDDLYLPWALSASAAALKLAPWSLPSLVLHPWAVQESGGRGQETECVLTTHRTRGVRSNDNHFFHGGWAYRRELFERAGGYPAMDNGEDRAFAKRLVAADAGQADPCALGFDPFYVYAWGTALGDDTRHLSALGRDGYATLHADHVQPARLIATDPPAVDLQNPRMIRHVMPRLF
jgi:hypothetical protein